MIRNLANEHLWSDIRETLALLTEHPTPDFLVQMLRKELAIAGYQTLRGIWRLGSIDYWTGTHGFLDMQGRVIWEHHTREIGVVVSCTAGGIVMIDIALYLWAVSIRLMDACSEGENDRTFGASITEGATFSLWAGNADGCHWQAGSILGDARAREIMVKRMTTNLKLPEGLYPSTVEVWCQEIWRKRCPFPTKRQWIGLLKPQIAIPMPDSVLPDLFVPYMPAAADMAMAGARRIRRMRMQSGGPDWQVRLETPNWHY